MTTHSEGLKQNNVMDEDEPIPPSIASVTAHEAPATGNTRPKEVILFECSYPICSDEDGEPKTFETKTALQDHIDKVHCGNLSHRLCTRCGLKPVYFGTVPVQPIRGGRYSRNTASPATNCVYGKGRKLPFEPLQGLSEPNMIPLPLQNLSHEPPMSKTTLVHPASVHMPVHHSAALHSPPQSQPNNNLHQPTQHLSPRNSFADEGEDRTETLEDFDRPKRSTRIRRSSAAASQASSYISSPYGLSAKQARLAATQTSTSAKQTAPAHHTASTQRKSKKGLAKPTATRGAQPIPPPIAAIPPKAQADLDPSPSDMNAFLDLINLCTSIVDP